MFGSKKSNPQKIHTSRWDTETRYVSIRDTFSDKVYEYSDLVGAYSGRQITLWSEGQYLTTVGMSPALFKIAHSIHGLKQCNDFVPLNISETITSADSKDFFFIGKDLHNIKEAFSVEKLTVEDLGNSLQVTSEDQVIAIFTGQNKDVFTGALNIAVKVSNTHLSDETLHELKVLEENEKAEKVRKEKTDLELEEYTKHSQQGFPDVVLTTESVSPFPVAERLGIVTAEYVHRTKLLEDVFAELTSIGKNRNESTQNALKQARDNALTELKREAYLLGADAVVAVDLDYSEIGGAGNPLLFLVASGTAIKIVKS